ncbi:MAG: hypothetical protein MUO26_02375 [Methanotrichaceae archaeon]|nr:hypothetical protein [Methanotrichaceae archaeon]
MKYAILPMLLVLFLIAGQSAAQDVASDNESMADNATVPAEMTVPEEMTVNETSPSNVTVAEGNATAASDLRYIWSITGIEPSQVTMVLNQEGEDLYGQAKYEPDSGEAWNAIVVGSISGDKVDLVLTALAGKELVSTKMSGTFSNESVAGKYVRATEGKIASRGDFNSVWINPDIASYTPAKIAEMPQEAQVQPGTTQNATVEQTTQQPVQLSKTSRFVDVRQYKDKIGPGGDLSGIPPGMSGFV